MKHCEDQAENQEPVLFQNKYHGRSQMPAIPLMLQKATNLLLINS